MVWYNQIIPWNQTENQINKPITIFRNGQELRSNIEGKKRQIIKHNNKLMRPQRDANHSVMMLWNGHHSRRGHTTVLQFLKKTDHEVLSLLLVMSKLTSKRENFTSSTSSTSHGGPLISHRTTVNCQEWKFVCSKVVLITIIC